MGKTYNFASEARGQTQNWAGIICGPALNEIKAFSDFVAGYIPTAAA